MGFGRPEPEGRVPPERRGRTIRAIVGFFRPYRGRIAVGQQAHLVELADDPAQRPSLG